MLVLDIYGKIEKTCISKKLGLYISNLPNEEFNEWKDSLAEELLDGAERYVKTLERSQIKRENPLRTLYANVLGDETLDTDIDIVKMCQGIASRMICLYQEYDYSDMPLGDWTENCFDGRFCEEDYSEKLLDFLRAIKFSEKERITCIPGWIYTSNKDEVNCLHLFRFNPKKDEAIKSLKNIGEILDEFLVKREDYLLLDYIVNALHESDHTGAYYIQKMYSLCELFLEKNKDAELDWKLAPYLSDVVENNGNACAEILRKMRNKLAHGDFLAFDKLCEEYAKQFMDGRFAFDYTEYSRKNWVIMSISCLLDDTVGKLMYLKLVHDDSLTTLKKCKSLDDFRKSNAGSLE